LEDKPIAAYLLIVDKRPFRLLEMPEYSGYYYSAWPKIRDAWREFLPEKWRSFSVLDIPRRRVICGAIAAS
jgi:hypothetical protein